MNDAAKRWIRVLFLLFLFLVCVNSFNTYRLYQLVGEANRARAAQCRYDRELQHQNAQTRDFIKHPAKLKKIGFATNHTTILLLERGIKRNEVQIKADRCPTTERKK